MTAPAGFATSATSLALPVFTGAVSIWPLEPLKTPKRRKAECFAFLAPFRATFVLNCECHKGAKGVDYRYTPATKSYPLDERNKPIRILRRLLLGDVVNWITTEDPTIRHLEDYGSGNYPSE